jgi:superfamily II DNA or RNA helicase
MSFATLNSQGIKYEKYIQDLIKSNYKECWIWNELHKEQKIKMGLLNCDNECDIGYDIVCLNNDNTYTYIQCKNFTTTGINNTIQIEDLAGFYNFVAENLVNNAIVYYSGNLSKQILMRKNKIKYINIQYVRMDNADISPRDYQLEAFSTLENVNRGVLEMPCGTGKTLVSYLLANKYDNIILLSPLIATTDQLVIHYTNYYGVNMSKVNCTVIHSQNTRNLESITLGDKNILGATFESCDVINKLLMKLKGSIFVVIDECHNLTQAMISDPNHAVNKLLNNNTKIAKILFVSATPKNYEGFENIFGTARYTLGWDRAIENKYVCDFNFYYPNSDKIIHYLDEIKFDKTIIEKTKLIYKAFFLLESIKSLDIKKCIVYLRNIEEVKHFKNILGVLNIYFNLFYNVNVVTGNSNKKERDVALTKFRNRITNICILLNVYVLDEGIDIPECDSVYLTNPNNNPTSIIQRISRANRLCEGKTVAKVLVWSKNELKIKDVLKNIGSYIKVKYGNVNSKFLNNHDKVESIDNNILENFINKKPVEVEKEENQLLKAEEIKEIIPNKTTICDKCKIDFRYVSLLERHISNKKSCIKTYPVEENPKKEILEKEKKKIIDKKKYQCKDCNLYFSCRQSLYKHMKFNRCISKKNNNNNNNQNISLIQTNKTIVDNLQSKINNDNVNTDSKDSQLYINIIDSFVKLIENNKTMKIIK